MKKRILSSLLALCLLFSLFSTAAFATDGTSTKTVTGATAYVVNSAADYDKLPAYIQAANPWGNWTNDETEIVETSGMPWLVVAYSRNTDKSVTLTVGKDNEPSMATSTSPAKANASAYQMWSIKDDLTPSTNINGTYTVTLSTADEEDVATSATVKLSSGTVTTAPKFDNATANITKGVAEFTLSNASTYNTSTIWTVYQSSADFGLGKVTNPVATFGNRKLTLTFTNSATVPAKGVTYTITAMNQNSLSSARTATVKVMPELTYAVSIVGADAQNTVDITPSDAATIAEGTEVTLTPKPSAGKTLHSISVATTGGRTISTTSNPDGTYSFTMPSTGVTFTVEFSTIIPINKENLANTVTSPKIANSGTDGSNTAITQAQNALTAPDSEKNISFTTSVLEKAAKDYAPTVDAADLTSAKATASSGTDAQKTLAAYIQADGTLAENNNAKFVTQIYMEIAVTNAVGTQSSVSTPTSVTYSITPKAQVLLTSKDVATTNVKTVGADANAVLVGAPKPVAIASSTVVKLPVPFDAGTYTVVHVKTDGTTYRYSRTVSNGMLTFTSTHGFSEFSVYTENTAPKFVTEVNGAVFSTLQSAVDAAANNSTITLLTTSLNGADAIATTNGKTGIKFVTGTGVTGSVKLTINGQVVNVAAPSSSTSTTNPTNPDKTKTYAVSINTTKNGSVTSSLKEAQEGTTVTLTVTPDKDYVLDDLTAAASNGKTVTVKEKNDKYTFSMPAAAVTITATFKEKPTTPTTPTQPPANTTNLPFADVKTTDWFLKAVQYVYSKETMTGVSSSLFAPNKVLTRAEMAEIFYNMEKKPTVTSSSKSFKDVSSNSWYYNAVTWAASVGMVNGVGDNLFAPTQSITRQEMAAMFHRYVNYKGSSSSASGNLNTFSDGSAVSAWALDDMKWAVGAKLINGKSDGRLDPKGTATRAEIAQVLYNFDNM